MTRKRKLILAAIDDLAVLAVFYGLAITPVYFITGDSAVLWWMGLIAVPFWANFAIRRVTKVFWQSLLAHLPLLAAVAFVSQFLPMHPVLWIAVGCVLTLFSLVRFSSFAPRGGYDFMIFSALAFLALTIFSIRAENFLLASVYPVVVTVIVIARVIVLHMLQMDASLEAIRLASEQPVRRIIAFDYKLAAGLGLVVLTLALVLYFVLIAPALGFIARVMPGIPQMDIAYREVPELFREYPHQGTGGFDPSLFDEVPPSPVAEVILAILSVVVGAMAISLGIYFLYLITLAVLRLLNSRARRLGADGKKDFAEDEKEFILPLNVKRPRPIKTLLQNEHPTRRLFRETVTQSIKMGVPLNQSDTPTEITNTIQSRTQADDIAGLAEEYAKVRYG